MKQLDKEMEELKYNAWFGVLDDLRESGKINMYGAPTWLMTNFGMPKEDCVKIFEAWTETYRKTKI